MPRKRAPNGTGTIKQLKNGTWQARITAGRNEGTGKYIYAYATFSTTEEARKWATKTANEVDAGTYVKPSKLSLNEWIDIWLETCTGNYADITMVKSRINNYISPYLGAAKTAAITPTLIQNAYKKIRSDYQKKNGKAISEKTIRNIHAVLAAIMRDFVEEGGRKENPCQYVSHRLPHVEHKEMPQLSEEELSALLKAFPGHPYGNLFMLAMFTGMRQGELLGLHWSDVDFKNNRIAVHGQLCKPKTKGEQYKFTPTKNRKSRVIYMTTEVIEALQSERKRQNVYRLQAGPAWDDSAFPDLVFTNEIGGHLAHATVYRQFKKLLKQVDVTPIRFHDTRHIFAFLSFASGADPVTTQKQLGHATAKFTQEVYAYSPDERKQRAASAISAYIASNLKAQ